MAELLVDLPNGTQRDMVMAGFKKMMDGLLPLQVTGGADDGMWRQVLDLTSAQVEELVHRDVHLRADHRGQERLADAIRNTRPAARRGWNAIANKTNTQGRMDRVCPGTGAAQAGQTLAQQQAFYTGITLGSNDLHGQAPLLWAAHALLRTDCPGVR